MSFERTVLPSGIRVVTARMPAQRSVSLGMWIGTGSRDEPDELGGATHFLEHLVFKGTSRRTAFEIAEAFDAVGGDLNAFTTNEMTCFHSRTLTEDLPMSIEIVADMLRNATLDADDVESERGVVLEEISMHEDTPDELVFDVFNETFWDGHAIGRRVQGFPETVERMTRDDIARFYSERYAPAGIVVSVAGACEHSVVVDTVAKAFGDDPRPAPSPRPKDEPSAVPALKIVERDIEQCHVVYGSPGIARADERRWALGVLNVILGGGTSSRLFQEIREKRGLAYTVGSGHSGYTDTGVFSVYAGCSPEHAVEVMKIVRDQIDSVVADGLTDEEVARGVGQLRGSLVMSLDESGALMSHLGKGELALGEIVEVDEMIRRVEAVTTEAVHAVARDVLGTGPWTLCALGPDIPGDLTPFAGTSA